LCKLHKIWQRSTCYYVRIVVDYVIADSICGDWFLFYVINYSILYWRKIENKRNLRQKRKPANFDRRWPSAIGNGGCAGGFISTIEFQWNDVPNNPAMSRAAQGYHRSFKVRRSLNFRPNVYFCTRNWTRWCHQNLVHSKSDY